ncbi:MAG: hypothetical protein ACKVU4_07825 [Phycisphaerales bacterium]
MLTTLDTLTLASDAGEVAVMGGLTLGLVAILGSFVTKIVSVRSRERTKREIAAYIAEGSMTPEDGERILKAEGGSRFGGGC